MVVDEHIKITESFLKGLAATKKCLAEADEALQQSVSETILAKLMDAAHSLEHEFTEAADMAEYVWSRCVYDDVGFKIFESPPGLGELQQNQDMWKPRGSSDAFDTLNEGIKELGKMAKKMVDADKLEQLSLSAAKAHSYASTLMANREIVLKNRLRIDTKEQIPDAGYLDWSRYSAAAKKITEDLHLWKDRIPFAKLLKRTNTKTKRKLDFHESAQKRQALADRSNKKPTRQINGSAAAESGTKRPAQQNKPVTRVAEAQENEPIAESENAGVAENEVAFILANDLKCHSEEESETPPSEPVQQRRKVTPSDEPASGSTPCEPVQRRSKVTPNDEAGPGANPPREPVQQRSKVIPADAPATFASADAATKKSRSDTAKYKTVNDLPKGSYYFKCPAKLCNKVTLWSSGEDDKQIANKQGMKLLEEDAVTCCRQIDYDFPQLIPAINFYGFGSMRNHIKKCRFWATELEECGSREIPALYRDRRIKIKEDGSHELTRKEKKDLLNQKAKQKRVASEHLVAALVSHWDHIGPQLAEIGITKRMIPHKGEGFMFPAE